jgi:hypothetical protein
MGRDRSLGIATGYRLDGVGNKFRWGRDFPHLSRPALVPTSLLYNGYRVPTILLYNGYRVFPAGKAAGGWRWPPTPSSAEVKERVELYIYSPSGSSRPVLWWNLPLPLLIYQTSLTSSGSRVVLCGQTDRHKEANSRISLFCESV